MIPPIAIENHIELLLSLLTLWALYTAPLAVIFCFIVWSYKL